MKKLIELYISGKLHKGKRHIVRLLLKLLPYKTVRSYYGPVMVSLPQDVTNVYAISGNYGHVIYDHIKSLPQDSVFIDVGANYGLYSLVAANQLEKGKVISFEPNPAIYPLFSENIALNDAKNVSPVQAAVGEEDGTAYLCYTATHSGVSHIVNKADEAGDDQYEVSILNVAEYDPIIEAAGSSKDINVKIDVEGFEMNIIKALQKAPWYKNIKSMVVEIDERNLQKFGSSTGELYKTLANDGFTALMEQTTEKQYDCIFVRN